MFWIFRNTLKSHNYYKKNNNDKFHPQKMHAIHYPILYKLYCIVEIYVCQFLKVQKPFYFMDNVFSLYRSVVVAPKKSGVAASASTLPAVPAATAASVSGGTPMDSVAVVSSGDTSQSSSAEAAGTDHSHPQGFSPPFITHLSFPSVVDNFGLIQLLQ